MQVAGIIRQDTGVGLYRIGAPVQFIKRQEGTDCRVTPFTGKNMPKRLVDVGNSSPAWSDKTLMEITKGADVILSNSLFDEEELLKILNLRRWSGAKLVFDIDDDLYAVSTDNPAHKNVPHLIRAFEKCLMVADGVTVSTPALKELYSKLNPNIYVNPNGQDIQMWRKVKTKNGTHKGIRIGWRGASGHGADVSLVKPALDELKKKYDITFCTLGVEPPFKPDEHWSFVGTLEFPKTLDKMDLDIAVVPLIDKRYNRAKSNIAVQEFGMLKIPCVASPVENQKDMDGVLYANSNYEWFEQLERLIKDKALRKEKGKEVYDYVVENYDMKKLTKPFVKWLEELPRKDF